MKLIRLALAAALFATIAVPASAQTFKTDYSTQLILAGGAGVGGGTNTINTVTLNAASNGSAPITFTLPDTLPALSGYLLTVSPTGGFYWTNPALGLTLGGDVIGQAGHNTVIGASGTAFHVVHDISVGGGQHVTGADTIGGNLDIAGGTSVVGNDTVLGTLYANGNANIDAKQGTAGAITIGNSGLNNGTPDSSVTTINGAVNFTGPVNIPAGDLSLGLADDQFYIGNSNGKAAPQTISQDVSITDAGIATVLSAHGNFRVGGNDTITGSQDVTGNSNVTGNDTITGNLDVKGNFNLGGPTSTDSITGNVNFNGPTIKFKYAPSFPAGSFADSSLSVAPNDILVGNATGNADSAHVMQDVTFENAGGHAVTATVNSSNATTFAVVNAETVGTTLGVTGQTTLGSAQLSASANVDVTAGGAIAIGNAHSYVPLTTTGTQTAPITSFTGENMGAGQILTFSNVGANNITLHSTAGTFSLNGGDVIMGPGGTATLLSTGTNWILLSSQ